MNAIIGIDPGLSGGYAIRFADKPISTVAYPMPLVGGEIDVSEIAEHFSTLDSVKVFIEKVHSMPKQGVSSTFKFGVGYGKLLGMCQVMGWSYELVTPQAWKKVVLAGTSKDKDAAIQVAHRLYPEIKLLLPKCRKAHDGMADALCVLEWGLRRIND